MSPFSGPKRAIWEEKRMQALQLRKETESHNARFDGEKCDTAPENAYNRIGFTDFSIA
ncbi:hypothetical protein QUF72_18895 [Desulfobacterales bacterium HSG2]|nr:hypothetical protein [Desulfobacterales bacterium HSG2]